MKYNFNYYVKYTNGDGIPIAGFLVLSDAQAFVCDYTYVSPLEVVDADGRRIGAN